MTVLVLSGWSFSFLLVFFVFFCSLWLRSGDESKAGIVCGLRFLGFSSKLPCFSSSVCWVFLRCSSNDFRFNSSSPLSVFAFFPFVFQFFFLFFCSLPPVLPLSFPPLFSPIPLPFQSNSSPLCMDYLWLL